MPRKPWACRLPEDTISAITRLAPAHNDSQANVVIAAIIAYELSRQQGAEAKQRLDITTTISPKKPPTPPSAPTTRAPLLKPSGKLT